MAGPEIKPISSRRRIKRFLPQTLFGRSLLIIMTPVVLLQIISAWIFYDRHWDTMTARLTNAVSGEIRLVADQMDREPKGPKRQEILDLAEQSTDLEFSFLEKKQLPAKPKTRLGILGHILAGALQQNFSEPIRVIAKPKENEYEVNIQRSDGLLKVNVPQRRIFSSSGYIFLLWSLGWSIVLFTVALLFMRNQIRPIRRLALAVESFGKGRDVPNFRPEGAAEVRKAAAAFQIMRERIQRQITQRTEMLAGVSHDLRTPLTRMKLQLAMLPVNTEVNDLKADVAEMETMIEGYLAFARGEGEEAVQEIDVVNLITEVAIGLQRQGAQLQLDIPSHLKLLVRPHALKRCLNNLMGNAARYATHIWVQVKPQNGFIEIMIEDDGPGIPEHLREEVFRPFFRIESSRNTATGGVGLGLTIARDIARSHGGDVILGDSSYGGLRATIRLPI